MGQKVNPVGFRVGVNHAWGSRWFAPKKTFGALLVEDQKIREVIKRKLVEAGISGIWNFTSEQLDVPEGIVVQDVDLAQSLAVLSHAITRG